MSTYRCFYAPLDKLGSPNMAEAGVLPYVQLQATSASDALRKAHHVTGCPVTEAERQEEVIEA